MKAIDVKMPNVAPSDIRKNWEDIFSAKCNIGAENLFSIILYFCH